ncbi:MAG: methyltransferase family protein [Candidatus Hodarchaeales archaeon]
MNKKLLPPKYLNVFLIIPIVLHFILPALIIISLPYTLLGFIAIFGGLAINVWSVRELKRNLTTIEFDETTTKLVVDGPFSISRNPIYLSGVILSLGIAVLLGSLISFIFPVALILILNNYHIPSEELKLEKTFGEEYISYKKSVRRWI